METAGSFMTTSGLSLSCCWRATRYFNYVAAGQIGSDLSKTTSAITTIIYGLQHLRKVSIFSALNSKVRSMIYLKKNGLNANRPLKGGPPLTRSRSWG